MRFNKKLISKNGEYYYLEFIDLNVKIGILLYGNKSQCNMIIYLYLLFLFS